MTQDRKDTPDLGRMLDDALLFGIGVLAMTREKLGEVGDDLIERGRKAREEAAPKAEAHEPRRAGAHDAATEAEVEALRREVADLRTRLGETPPADADTGFVP